MSVKRAQADKPLAPSVKYEVEIRRFRSLYGLEIMDSEIDYTPSFKNAVLRRKKPKMNTKTACTTILAVHAVLLRLYKFSY